MREKLEEKRATNDRAHGLTLENRRRAALTGVDNVESFNEQMVVLNTSAGTLTLLGEELHISHLNLQEGELLVEGQIAALEYDEPTAAKRGGLLAKLFR